MDPSTSGLLLGANNQPIKSELHQNISKPAKQEALIKEIGDTVNLSSESIEAFFEAEATRLNATIENKTITNKTFALTSIENNTSFTKIIGSRNTINDSIGNDILYLKGSINNIYHDSGSDSIMVDGSSNNINLNGIRAEIALLGTRNKVSANPNTISNIALSGESNMVNTGDKSDAVFSNGNRNKIMTAAGDDTIISDGDNNIITSDVGNDFIMASGNAQSIDTGNGDDSASIQGSGIIYTRSGNDIIELKSSQFSAYAGSGNDMIILESSGNQIFGEEGNDTIYAKNKEGYSKIDGGLGVDTLQLDFNREDASVIAKGNNIKFFFNDTDSLEFDLTSIENIKFKNEETFTIDQVKAFKGEQLNIAFDSGVSLIQNTKTNTNVANLELETSKLISGSKTVTGIKINYFDDTGKQKSLQLTGFDYLKMKGGSYLSIDMNGDFLNLNVDHKNSLILTEDITNDKTKINIYDPNTDKLIQTNLVNNRSSVLFSDESVYTVDALKNSFFGKSTEIEASEETRFEPEDILVNVAKVNLNATTIYRIDSVGSNQYNLIYKNGNTSASLQLKNVTFLETNEGSKINLSEYGQKLAEIKRTEKSHDIYSEAHKNTEFKRISYNLTGNIKFIESLIDGGYDDLSNEEKTLVQNNANVLKNSLEFTTNKTSEGVDAASKDLFALRLSNLLRNNSNTLQELNKNGFGLFLSTAKDLGGDASGFVTGFAEFSGDSDDPQFKISLTYSTFYGGMYDGNDGDNVDIHETMHLIDYLNDKNSGLPFAISDSTAAQYESARNDLFESYQKTKNDIGSIRTYGFTDINEFLAVSSEVFYETPEALAETNLSLYEALSNYFNTI